MPVNIFERAASKYRVTIPSQTSLYTAGSCHNADD